MFPIAETAKATVNKVPRSAEVMNPTYFIPRLATILHGFCTVVIPVSSAFQISPGPNLLCCSTTVKLSKNWFGNPRKACSFWLT